jgi:protein-tyrosine phosphatase
MIDIHSHILPETDDGAKSWPQAVEMCHMAAADGITHIVATPHANFTYRYDRKRHAETAQRLQEQIGNALQIRLGCDFHMSAENIAAALENPAGYVIAESRYLLVELSDFSIPPALLEGFHSLIKAGLRPILTHPERNPLLQRRPEPVVDWVRNGLLVQVTAGSLTGLWGRTAQLVARWLLEQNAVHAVATDAHDPRYRPPLLSSARRVLCNWQSEEVARALVEDNPAAILRDEDLPRQQ